MNKKFTLIEIIVSIVVLGILLAIILVNINSSKKEAIRAAVNTNTSILQNSVDTYFLKGNQSYPTVNQEKPKLSKPVLIDVKYLTEKGFIKQDLDISKIKTQYYWLDYFGTVWGATENPKESVVFFAGENDKKIEFNGHKNLNGYSIYEVNGYELAKETSANLNQISNTEKTSVTKKYKEVLKKYLISTEKDIIQQELDIEGDFLISFHDQYDLEVAPFGPDYSSTFDPILNREGEFIYEIENERKMIWIDFQEKSFTPGSTSVRYEFQVQDENGVYMDWVEDFHSLPNSNGIRVKSILKGDSNGNFPSIIDLRVLYTYEKEDLVLPVLEVEDPYSENIICPKTNIVSTIQANGKTASDSNIGTIVIPFFLPTLMEQGDYKIPKVDIPFKFKVTNTQYYISNDNISYEKVDDIDNVSLFDKCMLVEYEIEVDLTKETPFICGENGKKTSFSVNALGKKEGIIVFSLKLNEGESLNAVELSQNKLAGYKIKKMQVEFSTDGQPYKIANSIKDLETPSCVNIIYFVEELDIMGYPPECNVLCQEQLIKNVIKVPVCIEDCGSICTSCVSDTDPNSKSRPSKGGDGGNGGGSGGGCIGPHCSNGNFPKGPTPDWVTTCNLDTSKCATPPVCLADCVAIENKGEWTTVNVLRFFAEGERDTLTKWLDVQSEEYLPPNTRVVYSYAKNIEGIWSHEYSDFTKTDMAERVVANAYLQVKTKHLKDPGQEHPNVVWLKFFSDQSVIEKVNKGIIVISPKKDNNKTNANISSASNVEWTYQIANVPLSKVQDVEWGGDYATNYKAGKYTVQARIAYKDGTYSDWTKYPFTVYPEKPVAVITHTPLNIFGSEDVKWNYLKSYDPDGDKIVDVEWRGDKKSSYPKKGIFKVGLRVKDSDGYWSDWAEKSFNNEAEEVIYRLEAEDKTSGLVSVGLTDSQNVSAGVSSNAKYSKGAALNMNAVTNYSERVTNGYKIKGSGFDIKFYQSTNVYISVDGVRLENVPNGGEYLYSYRGLEDKEHTIAITAPSFDGKATVDYLDVYSTNDKPEFRNVHSRTINEAGVKSTFLTNKLVSNLNENLWVSYDLLKNSNVTIDIVDSNDSLVRNIQARKYQEGGSQFNYSLIWDGLDNNGDIPEQGIYYIRIKAEGILDLESTTHRYAVDFLSNKPTYRLEAEDTTSKMVSLSNSNSSRVSIGPINGTSYSGGKAVSMNAKTNYSERVSTNFTIDGNGFDVVLANAAGVVLRVDGVAISSFTQSGIFSYSVRDLEEGKHSVNLTASSFNGSGIVDYIDVYSTNDKPVFSELAIKRFEGGKSTELEVVHINTYLQENVQFRYRQFKDGKTSATIVDENMNEVASFYKNKSQTGGSNFAYTINWDGSGSNESPLAEGTYYLKLESKGILNKFTGTSLVKIEVLSTKPAERIEAETTDKTKATLAVSNSSRVSGGKTTNAAYSGGAGISMSANTNYSESVSNRLYFTGTGFDLKLIKGNYAYVYLDEVLIETIISSTPITISRSGLADGNHTVRVTVSSGKKGSGVVDYLDVYK